MPSGTDVAGPGVFLGDLPNQLDDSALHSLLTQTNVHEDETQANSGAHQRLTEIFAQAAEQNLMDNPAITVPHPHVWEPQTPETQSLALGAGTETETATKNNAPIISTPILAATSDTRAGYETEDHHDPRGARCGVVIKDQYDKRESGYRNMRFTFCDRFGNEYCASVIGHRKKEHPNTIDDFRLRAGMGGYRTSVSEHAIPRSEIDPSHLFPHHESTKPLKRISFHDETATFTFYLDYHLGAGSKGETRHIRVVGFHAEGTHPESGLPWINRFNRNIPFFTEGNELNEQIVEQEIYDRPHRICIVCDNGSFSIKGDNKGYILEPHPLSSESQKNSTEGVHITRLRTPDNQFLELSFAKNGLFIAAKEILEIDHDPIMSQDGVTVWSVTVEEETFTVLSGDSSSRELAFSVADNHYNLTSISNAFRHAFTHDLVHDRIAFINENTAIILNQNRTKCFLIKLLPTNQLQVSTVPYNPTFIHYKFMSTSDTTELVPEQKPVNAFRTTTAILIPSGDSLHHVLFPARIITLTNIRLTGQIGGYTIDEDMPLILRGAFKDSAFIPYTTEINEGSLHLMGDGFVNYRVIQDGDGFAIVFVAENDTAERYRIITPLITSQGYLAASTDPAKGKQFFNRGLNEQALTNTTAISNGDWAPVSELNMRQELLRLLSQDFLDLENDYTFMKLLGSDDTFLINFTNNVSLIITKTKIGDQVAYAISSKSNIFNLVFNHGDSQRNIVGLSVGESARDTTTFSPWKGELTLSDILHQAHLYTDTDVTRAGLAFDQKTNKIYLIPSQTEDRIPGEMSLHTTGTTHNLKMRLDTGDTFEIELTDRFDDLDDVAFFFGLPEKQHDDEFHVNSISAFSDTKKDYGTLKHIAVYHAQDGTQDFRWVLETQDGDHQVVIFHNNGYSFHIENLTDYLNSRNLSLTKEEMQPDSKVEEALATQDTDANADQEPEHIEPVQDEREPTPAEQPIAPTIPVWEPIQKPTPEVIPTPAAIQVPVAAQKPQKPIPRFTSLMEPQAFMLPAGGNVARKQLYVDGKAVGYPVTDTRTAMRDAYSDVFIPEGTTSVFTFLGQPNSKDRMPSAKKLLPATNRHGEASSEFFGSIIQIPVVFKNGEWIPDLNQPAYIEHRTPVTGQAVEVVSRRRRRTHSPQQQRDVIGNKRHPDSGLYQFRIDTSKTDMMLEFLDDSGQALKTLGGKSLHAHVFRSPIKISDSQDKSVSHAEYTTDWGISYGPPTSQAYKLMASIHDVTGGTKLVKRRLRKQDDSVRYERHGRAINVTPKFGHPIFRSHAMLSNRNVIVEYAPGFVAAMPDARFTQLKIHDGNGLSISVIFGHRENNHDVLGVFYQGQKISQDDLLMDSEGNNLIMGCDVQIPIRLADGELSKKTVNLRIVARHSDKYFQPIGLLLDEEQIEISRLHISPADWDQKRIKNHTEVALQERLIVRRITPKEHQKAVPRSSSQSQKAEQQVYVPNNVDLQKLAGATTSFDSGWVKFPCTATITDFEETLPGEIKIRMKWNEDRHIYEPVINKGSAQISMTRGKTERVAAIRTENRRAWTLTLENGQEIHIGNFFVSASSYGQRPAPVVWATTGKAPDRRPINRFLRDNRFSDSPITIALPKDNSDTDVVIKNQLVIDGQKYGFSWRRIIKADGRVLFVPASPVEHVGTEKSQVIPTAYYRKHTTMPPVIVFGIHVFEVLFNSKKNQLVMRKTLLGVASAYEKFRAEKRVFLDEGKISAKLLIDLNDDNFQQAVRQVAQDKSGYVSRQVIDALTGDIFEFVFDVKTISENKFTLVPVGVAQVFSDANPQVIGLEYINYRGKLCIRLSGDQFVQLPEAPKASFVLTSHGQSLSSEVLLDQDWHKLKQDPSLFSGAVQQPNSIPPKTDSLFYQSGTNRFKRRQELSNQFGFPAELIWNIFEPFPRGRSIESIKDKYDYESSPHTDYKVNQRGLWKITTAYSKHGHEPKKITVTYDNKPIPATLTRNPRDGRPYIILQGAFSGIVFYIDTFDNIVEISHPLVSLTALRDLGYEPKKSRIIKSRILETTAGEAKEVKPQDYLPKLELKADAVHVVSDHPIMSQDDLERLASSTSNQIIQNRLHNIYQFLLSQEFFSEQDTETQNTLLSCIYTALISDPQNYSSENTHPVAVFEDLIEEEALTESMTLLLDNLAHGGWKQEHLQGVLSAFQAWQLAPEAQAEQRFENLQRIITTLANKEIAPSSVGGTRRIVSTPGAGVFGTTIED